MDSRILIVEDDEFLRDGLCEILTKEKYTVKSVGTVNDAKQIFDSLSFDLIILDVMLPDGNGLDMCAHIRAVDTKTPILFLTACDDEIQTVRGLDAGADDYVTKPFKLLELLSRIRALLRRNSNKIYRSNNIVVDTEHMTVKIDNEPLIVTPTEFRILSSLIRNAGIIVTRDTLLKNIWDDNENYIDDNTLSVHVSRLREKVGSKRISTIRGIGYRWEDINE